ncbi:MAG TPA: hypothetical protein VK922_08550 [Gemmatimonadaceae bacterium]|nr:hypothetical protein [Gemmatimonadaceae bacterium]
MRARGLIATLLALVIAAPPLAAQERAVERRSFSDGQGKLMAFYSAVLTFTPVEAPRERRRGELAVGLELGYVPQLNAEQRRVGDKPESTNLAPVFPRPRVSYALTDRLAIEGSWIPPVAFFDVKANVVSLAVSWTAPVRGALRLSPRLAGALGSVEGAITCFDDLATRSPDLAEYWGLICYARESEDDFQPRHLLVELMAAWERPAARVTPYAGLGARGDWTEFDIGVIRGDGSRDPDQPILALRTVRPYGVLGATWRAAPRARATAELLYAPGSLVTIRLQGVVDAIRR